MRKTAYRLLAAATVLVFVAVACKKTETAAAPPAGGE